jgi:TetR/AcrR family transcriptional regulator
VPPRNPEETRYRLQEAAEREFARYGYAGARVARIARKARTNQRMVYHYFGGKQGLYEAVRRHASSEVADRLLTALASKIEDDPAAAYADTLRAYFEAALGHPTWARLLVHEALDPSPGVMNAARATEQNFVAAFEPAIRRAQATGHLRNDLTPLIGLGLASMASVIYPLLWREQWVRAARPFGFEVAKPDSAFLENMLSVILDGVRSREESR